MKQYKQFLILPLFLRLSPCGMKDMCEGQTLTEIVYTVNRIESQRKQFPQRKRNSC